MSKDNMVKRSNTPNKRSGIPAAIYVIGGVGIAALAFWLVPILIDDAQKSSDPWWGKGEIDRIEVRACEDVACKVYSSNIYEVMYNGKVSKTYTREDSLTESSARELSARAYTGLSWVNEDAINAWRQEVGMSGTKKVSEVDTIDEFQIFKQADHKNGIDAYGCCYQNHGDKSCIVFSKNGQYRLKP